jgi:hypothetical protein
MRRLIVRAVVALTITARVASAHPIHTTLTVVTFDAQGATFNLRAFADDFSAVVAKNAGKPAPRDSSASPADVQRYLDAHFRVVDAQGRPVSVQSCGVRREKELYWVCVRAVVGTGARIQNVCLTELHSDQVNIVQVENKTGRKTLLFTKDSPFSPVS